MVFAGLNRDETKMEKPLVTRKDHSKNKNLDAVVPLWSLSSQATEPDF